MAYQDFGSRRDFGSEGFQICVFKVDINCCKNCPKNMKMKLEDLDGIHSVEVDERRNLATVKGILGSRKIIKKLKDWGKDAELVHERKETNNGGYNVEFLDEDEQEEEKKRNVFNDSFCHRNSPDGHDNSSFRSRHKNKGSSRSRSRSSHKPEKCDHYERNAYSAKEVPDHICRDKYCTLHRRDDMNYGAGYPSMFRGGLGLNYDNYSPMNSYVPPPPMYGPPPPPEYGQYYDPGMMPPMPGYGGYAKYGNGCSIM